jgi:DNA-binding response OmpR family regulator
MAMGEPAEPIATILLVDDDPSIIRALGTRLRVEGYAVVTAMDGQKGLDLALAVVPDLLILDVNLPRRVGFSISRMLKLDERTRRIPILMLTARDQEADLRLGVVTGADAYMTKPYDTQALLTTLKSLLEASRR